MVVKSFKIWIVLAVASVGFLASTESVRAASKSNAHYSKQGASAVNRSSAVRKSPSFAAKPAGNQNRAASANRSISKAPATRSQGSSFNAARKPATSTARSQSTGQIKAKPQFTAKPRVTAKPQIKSKPMSQPKQVARGSGNAGFKKAVSGTPKIQSTAKPKIAALPKTLKSKPAAGRVNSNGGHITKNVPLTKPTSKPLTKVGTGSIAKKGLTPNGPTVKKPLGKVGSSSLAKSGVAGKKYVNKAEPVGQTNQRIVDVWEAPPVYQPAYQPKVTIPWTAGYNEPYVNVYTPACHHSCPQSWTSTCCPGSDNGCDTESCESATCDANGSCDSGGCDTQCSGYTCPSDEEATEEATGEVVLSNSADSAGPVNYVINGEYTYTIEPGQTQTLAAGNQWSIDFDRGDSTGSVHYDLTTGSYEFQAVDGHWDLFN